jgi:polyisoprenoid-binding protein YceI
MHQPSGQSTVPALPALLQDRVLAGEWVLDPGASSVRFKSGIFGLIPVRGVFRDVRGNGAVSADGELSGHLTVSAASVDTKNKRRDTHLRSADFFDSANNPDITFTTHDIRPSDPGVIVTGALSIRGHTRPVSFAATASVADDHHARIEAEIPINRSDFGIDWNWAGLVSMKTTVTVHAVFVRQ